MSLTKIAIWNTAFLGDAVLTLPLLKAVRNAFPDAEIDFFIRKGLKEFFEMQDYITRVFEINKDDDFSKMWQLSKQIRKHKYDLWLSPHLSLRSSFFAFRSNASMRIGYEEAALSSYCYTRRIYRQFGKGTEVERILKLYSLINLFTMADDTVSKVPEIIIPSSTLNFINSIKSKLPDQPFLAINPHSTWKTKEWCEDGFVEIAQKALKKDVNVILVGSKDEVEKGKRIENKVGYHSQFHNLTGKTTLLELAAVLSQMDCYLTNDSGPLHIAWGLSTPLVVILGPTTTALGFIPFADSSEDIIEIDLPCRPCGKHGNVDCPRGHHYCMKNITTDMVWEKVEAKLFSAVEEIEEVKEFERQIF